MFKISKDIKNPENNFWDMPKATSNKKYNPYYVEYNMEDIKFAQDFINKIKKEMDSLTWEHKYKADFK